MKQLLTELKLIRSLALVNLAALYGYGLWHCPGWTLLGGTVWLLVVLHCWPKEQG